MPGVTFGVPALDGRLGPLAPGTTLLFQNDPDVEALPWLLQAAGAHLKAGRPVVFLCVSRGPARVRSAIAALGFATQGEGGLSFIDAHSALSGLREPEAHHVQRPHDLHEVLQAIADEGHRHDGAVLLIESLDMLVTRFGAEAFHAARHKWREALDLYVFSAAAATQWTEGQEATSTFDAVVALRSVEQRIVLNQFFEVRRPPGEGDPCLYKVNRPGGIYAYIPKIVVVGPHNAGKTTVVHSATGGAVSVERMGTTVALDRGTMLHEGVRTEIFGTPGQDRFDALLPMLAGQASGAVLVVDATRPDTFARASQMLRLIWRQGLTAVVALNKQDLPAAMTPEQAGALLDLPEGVPLLDCVATDPAQARAVVHSVVQRILGGVR